MRPCKASKTAGHLRGTEAESGNPAGGCVYCHFWRLPHTAQHFASPFYKGFAMHVPDNTKKKSMMFHEGPDTATYCRLLEVAVRKAHQFIWLAVKKLIELSQFQTLCYLLHIHMMVVSIKFFNGNPVIGPGSGKLTHRRHPRRLSERCPAALEKVSSARSSLGKGGGRWMRL